MFVVGLRAQDAADDAVLRRLEIASELDAALTEVEGMAPARRVAILRRGLWLADDDASYECAARLSHDQLDLDEARRVIALLRPRLDSERGAETFEEFRQLIGSGEVGELLRDWPRPAAGWRQEEMFGQLHRQFRAAHLPQLCELAADADEQVGQAALRAIGTGMLAFTDRFREQIAHAYVVRLTGAPPPAVEPGGYSAGLTACLRVCLIDGQVFEGQWQGWLARWVRAASAAPADRELLVELAGQDEWYANFAAICGLGQLADDSSLAALRALAISLAERRERDLLIFARSRLARRGDVPARQGLDQSARSSPLALALLVSLEPAAGNAVLSDLLLGEDDIDAEVAFEWFESDAAEFYGLPLASVSLPGLVDAVRGSDVSGPRLLRIIATAPGCRDLQLARRAAADPALRDPEDDVWDIPGVIGYLSFLEVADRDVLLELLRHWACSADQPLRHFGASLLVRLGDAGDAEVAVQWAADDRTDPEDLVRLGGADGVAVANYLRTQLASADLETERGVALLEAMAVRDGMPLAIRWGARAVERLGAETVRAAVLAHHAPDALAQLLAGQREDPDAGTAIYSIGLLRDPRVRDYLRWLQSQRHLGTYAFATGELSLMGEADARAEQWLVFQEGRYRWVDNATRRSRTFNRELETLPFWTSEFESNCCRAVVAEGVWEDMFGLDFGRSEPPIHKARDWWQQHRGNVRWSSIAGHYVAGAD